MVSQSPFAPVVVGGSQLDFLSRLFDTSDFFPRWVCGNWSRDLGWIHIASDIGIWSA